jgi:hypothetical protein
VKTLRHDGWNESRTLITDTCSVFLVYWVSSRVSLHLRLPKVPQIAVNHSHHPQGSWELPEPAGQSDDAIPSPQGGSAMGTWPSLAKEHLFWQHRIAEGSGQSSFFLLLMCPSYKPSPSESFLCSRIHDKGWKERQTSVRTAAWANCPQLPTQAGQEHALWPRGSMFGFRHNRNVYLHRKPCTWLHLLVLIVIALKL